MALKHLLDLNKTDRYTADGRDKINELQAKVTEDVTYKTGDISQKTGLQKQPDGSWAPPKGGAKKPAGKKDAAKPTTEGLESKSTEELTNLFNELATKSVKEKSPENSAARDRVYKELKRRQKAESNPTDKYKDLPGAQKKDALYASTFEGSSIGMTQTSMERNGWDLVQADDNVNVYAKPDGSKVTMKHDGKKITSSEYEAPGSAESKPAENPDYPFKPKTSEERAERAKFEKDRDDFIERMNTYREESNQWTKRAKGERTATLVDWLDDWDKHPEEKNDAAYTAIERELASRGVKRENRAAAKEADNRERNESYRRAYDSAPRQLTGDCRIRVKRS